MKPELKTGLIVFGSVLVALALHQAVIAPMIVKIVKPKTVAAGGK